MSALLEKARSRFRAVVGVHEKPERIAAAWALGIALGLSPLLGLHTVLALLLALAFRLNKVDVLLGTLIINPWTITFYFPTAVFVGRRITGVRVPRFTIPHPEEVLHAAMWRDRAPWLRSVLLTWGMGATVFAVVGGGVTYFALSRLIAYHRRRHPHHSEPAHDAGEPEG